MSLPKEVMHIVFERLLATNVAEARNARFVCRAWAAGLKPLIFRNLQLIFSEQRRSLNEATFRCLREDTSIAELVRCVEVLDWYGSGLLPPDWPEVDTWVATGQPLSAHSDGDSTRSQVRTFQTLLPKFSLRRFCWKARPRIPIWLLKDLQHSGATLEIVLRVDHTLQPPTSCVPLIPAMESMLSLRNLRSTTCLISLAVALAATELQLFDELQAVVRSCPRLEDLTVYAITQTTTSIRERFRTASWPWRHPIAPNATEPAQFRNLQLLNICVCHCEPVVVSRFINWSYLRSLSITCPSFLVLLNAQLGGLRSLSLQVENRRSSGECRRQQVCEEVRACLLDYKELEVLRVQNMSSLIDAEILCALGQKLKNLDIHEDEYYYVQNDRQSISCTQIDAIHQHCSLLTSLSIDVECGTEWPLETFDLVRQKLGYIYHIGLNFELGRNFRLPTHKRYRPTGRHPQITEETAQQIFQYIHRTPSSTSCNDPLPFKRKMTISRGSKDRPDKPLLYGRVGHRYQQWYRDHSLSLVVHGTFTANPSDPYSLVVICPEVQQLRAVRKELGSSPHRMDRWIDRIANGLVMGPQLKPDSVLLVPGPFDLSNQ